MIKHSTLKINQNDNVAVALNDLKIGEVNIDNKTINLNHFIPQKHKFSLEKISKGCNVIFYGVIVGIAKEDIYKGDLISTSNVAHHIEGEIKFNNSKSLNINFNTEKYKDKTFLGYNRGDQVGTENNWLFFPLVFCQNKNIETLKDIFMKEFYEEKVSEQQLFLRDLINENNSTDIHFDHSTKSKSKKFENIDVKFITHSGGCGETRQDSATLGRLLAGYVNNPNVAGASILSLGCEHLQVEVFKKYLYSINPNFNKPLLFFNQQSTGNKKDLIKNIIKESMIEIKKANNLVRTPVSISKLVVGLECGGSDGFSGISSNPTIGRVSDIICFLGGSSILSEFPELCGVEQEIVNRSNSKKIARRFIDLMRTYEKRANDLDSGFDMNPSFGNIQDGLITDAMKSAGALKKGGSSKIVDVLDYTEYVKKSGLNLLCTPGNDVESTTGMVGSGANIVLFSTGLGTPTGNPICPVIKISSNSQLFLKMDDIIDFDCGEIITGNKTIEECSSDLIDLIIDIASGKTITKSSYNKQEDFIPWKRGISL